MGALCSPKWRFAAVPKAPHPIARHGNSGFFSNMLCTPKSACMKLKLAYIKPKSAVLGVPSKFSGFAPPSWVKNTHLEQKFLLESLSGLFVAYSVFRIKLCNIS